MLYSVVYYPDLRDKRIELFRKDHDPYADLIQEHLTIVFPFPAEIELQVLVNHVKGVLRKHEPFEAFITGFEKSWDHWLFLAVEQGKAEFNTIHEELYTGILDRFLRRDIEYKPHIGLGYFGGTEYDPLRPEALEFSETEYNKALEELKGMELSYYCKVNYLTIVELNDMLTNSRDICNVSLGKG
jgi:2'-5' RNA ligase